MCVCAVVFVIAAVLLLAFKLKSMEKKFLFDVNLFAAAVDFHCISHLTLTLQMRCRVAPCHILFSILFCKLLLSNSFPTSSKTLQEIVKLHLQNDSCTRGLFECVPRK